MGLRHGDWKLIVRQADGTRERELFNIADDPYEQHEIAADCPAKVKDLANMIADERQQDGSSAREDVDSPMVY